MDLHNLFKLQKQLDEHIYEEYPVQDGEDRSAKKILALQVELGELANEWRGYKFWSSRQEPTIKDLRVVDYKESGEAILETYNPFLEKYVDCLRFILSIGLELNIPVIYGTKTKWDELTSDETDITQQFLLVFENVNKLVHPIDWINLFEEFYILGKMLGFTWEQVEQVYFDKNKINHQRQESGY